MAPDTDALRICSNTRSAHTNARHSYANTRAAFRDACTKHPDIATGCADTHTFGGRMRPGWLHGSRGSRDTGWSGMVCNSTAALLIVARPPRPYSQLAGRALAVAALALALGCGRDGGGDAGPFDFGAGR